MDLQVSGTPYICLADERLGSERFAPKSIEEALRGGQPSGKGLSLAELPDALDEVVLCGGYSEEIRAATLTATNAVRRLLHDFGTEAGVDSTLYEEAEAE